MRIASGEIGKEVAQTIALSVTHREVKMDVTIWAPTTRNIIIAVVFTVSWRQIFNTDQLSPRKARVKTRAIKAPIAAASVGVITPRYIPPRTTTIVTTIG